MPLNWAKKRAAKLRTSTGRPSILVVTNVTLATVLQTSQNEIHWLVWKAKNQAQGMLRLGVVILTISTLCRRTGLNGISTQEVTTALTLARNQDLCHDYILDRASDTYDK